MLIKQAIFTSVRSGRNEGYQLAASSPGVASEDARELAQWGPGHDSLCDDRAPSGSINFHHLNSGLFCISRTVLAGREYSGRGGERVYTHNFLVSLEAMNRFANNPFRIMDALFAGGRTTVLESIPRQLDPIPLVGRASAANPNNLNRLNQELGPDKLATLLCAALETDALGVVTPIFPQRLFSGLLDLIPPPHRLQFTLTTGLKVSSRRPFRLAVLPKSPEEQRQAVRQVRLTPLDLAADPPTKFSPNSGWPQLVHELLQASQFATLASIADSLSETTEPKLDILAEQVKRHLDHDAELVDILTPFSA